MQKYQQILKIKLNCPLHSLKDIMSSSLDDTGYAILIDMNIETDPNIMPIASKSYTLSLQHQDWIRKELE